MLFWFMTCQWTSQVSEGANRRFGNPVTRVPVGKLQSIEVDDLGRVQHLQWGRGGVSWTLRRMFMLQSLQTSLRLLASAFLSADLFVLYYYTIYSL